LRGERLPRSPKWTLNAVGQYDFHVTENTKSFVRLEWSYRSKTTSDIEALATQLQPLDNATTTALGLDTSFNGTGSGNGISIPWPRDPFPFVVPEFGVFNLRAGVEGDRWSIIAYVENLADNHYYTGTQENFGLGGIRIRPHPRIYGISLRLWSK
jgi:iron complex outermembrane receptor protein